MDLLERMDALGSTLLRRVREQLSARAEIEQRWLDDLRQYHGKYSLETETRLERDQTGSSRLFVNRTRPKCKALIARLGDMLFPSDDRNWVMNPTPNPEIAGLAPEQGALLREEATRRAELMQREIDDQLTESHYIDKARGALWNLVVLGTAVIKGPVVTARMRRAWRPLDGATYALDLRALTQPGVDIISPWDFFPDMSARDVDEAEFFFERRYLTKKALRRLAMADDNRYRADAIRRVLEETPARYPDASDDSRQQLRAINGVSQGVSDTQYCVWEYHGPIEPEDARALGLDLPDDPLLGVEGVIEFIGTRVIRAYLHALDTQDPLYSVTNFIPDESGLFGYSLPYSIRAPQIVTSATWRMMQDNNAYSVGPQTVLDRECVEPANKVYALQAKKLWFFKSGSGKSIRDAMWAFNVDSQQPALMATYQAASQLIDEESGVPSLLHGEMGLTPAQTATATSMLMNSANAVLRDVIKDWDANITKPLLRRFYDYNMQYSDKPDIKGDFAIDARGSSALMVKETQAAALTQFLQIAQSSQLAPYIKFPPLLRKLVETLRLSTDELIKTDEEIRDDQTRAQQMAQAAPATDPRLLAAQAQQAQQQRLTMEQQAQQLKLQMHQEALDSKERVAAAELWDRQAARRDAMEKERLRSQEFQVEAALKQALGSGV